MEVRGAPLHVDAELEFVVWLFQVSENEALYRRLSHLL